MRTRRRRPAVTWLPTIGRLASPIDVDSGAVNGIVIACTTKTNALVLDTTIDVPFGDAQSDVTGADIPGTNALFMAQEYFLRRIVGKLFVAYSPDVGSSPTVMACAGFYVARQDGFVVNQPTGAGTLLERNSNYSPLGVDAQREPWIWRRSWLLGSGAAGIDIPQSNTRYGSVADGPHVDAKTKRRVATDERIFLSCSAYSLVDNTAAGLVSFFWDGRALVSARKPHNRGTF